MIFYHQYIYETFKHIEQAGIVWVNLGKGDASHPLFYWHSCHSAVLHVFYARGFFSGKIQQASENDTFWLKAELYGIIGTFDVHFSVLTNS